MKSAKTIGFMGVGFKSVFRSFQKVEVSSNGWRFCLKVPVTKGPCGAPQRDWIGCVLPIFDARIPDPSRGMTCRFLLSGRLDELSEIENDLTNVLQEDLSLLPLLAMNGVKELAWNDKAFRLSKHNVGSYGGGCTLIKIEAVDAKEPFAGSNQWLMFCREYFPSDEAILKFIEHRELKAVTPQEEAELSREVSKARTVQIFCRVGDNGVPLLPHMGRAYAVLPTEAYLPLRVKLQADWLLDISRKGFMDFGHDAWHNEIIQCVPELV